ncbi:hypothetical protein [Clostridium sp.]|nr:hypothetical protein [Clostridium sp.]
MMNWSSFIFIEASMRVEFFMYLYKLECPRAAGITSKLLVTGT